jgi:hypothetical protein
MKFTLNYRIGDVMRENISARGRRLPAETHVLAEICKNFKDRTIQEKTSGSPTKIKGTFRAFKNDDIR